MTALAAIGWLLGGAAVVTAALAVFLSGPPLLVRAARTLAVAGLIAGAAGSLLEFWSSGFQLDLRAGAGRGGLFAAAGMLLLTFGAARVAERRRAARDRERFMAAHEARRRQR